MKHHKINNSDPRIQIQFQYQYDPSHCNNQPLTFDKNCIKIVHPCAGISFTDNTQIDTHTHTDKLK